MGKAIYKPKGKAGEYAEYACNFYVGCSNGCTYCYCKKGWRKEILGGDTPTLKKCFRDEGHALAVFEKELCANLSELRLRGLLFSFTTDPMLDKTISLTTEAVEICLEYDVPVKILTKRADFCEWAIHLIHKWPVAKQLVALGFTLTGHDEIEPKASTNAERIGAMKKLHALGFKTWASIEPVIDIVSSMKMIIACEDHCDLLKIGLESGKKSPKLNLVSFIDWCTHPTRPRKVYFKDGLLKQAGIDRTNLPIGCVGSDYNIFTSK